MALDWDRLIKLQRDYPKPKFAEKEVQRQLKKKPLDPYLRIWKADLLLQLGDVSNEVNTLLDLSLRQQPVTDSRLLAYHYRTCRHAAKIKGSGTISRATAGDQALKAWQDAFSTLQSKAAKLTLLSDLFLCALRESCWDDVRWAAQKAGQQGLHLKKKSTFTQILARQQAYEEECRAQGSRIDALTSMDSRVAYSMMFMAWKNGAENPTDPVQLQDMRDLRFMAQIFARQHRSSELLNRWENVATIQAKILDDHRSEAIYLLLDSFCFEKKWEELALLCKSVVADYNTPNTTIQVLRSWKLWGSYMEAEMHLGSSDISARNMRILEVRDKELDKMTPGGREIDLTRMALTTVDTKNTNLLELCKMYWNKHHHINGSFHDLRRFVEVLDREQQEEFHAYITKASSDIKPDSLEHDKRLTDKWFRTELNVAKFDYLLTISRADDPSEEVLTLSVKSLIKLYTVGARIQEESYQDAGILAIWTLLKLAYHLSQSAGEELRQRSLYLTLQATMLALHLTAGEAGKQNRPLILLSTRLHMMHGFATIAFEQYQFARVKEILNNTISYILLNSISQIHPFDTTGSKSFYPDDELNKVVTSIKRMESRVDDFLYTGLDDFQYDQATELLEFKRKLRCSLTKHLCLVERRRIARLKCELVDSGLDCGIEDFEAVSDDRDLNVLPNFESSMLISPLNFIMMKDTPRSASWMYKFIVTSERCHRAVRFEPALDAAIDKLLSPYAEQHLGRDTEIDFELEGHTKLVLSIQRTISLIPQDANCWEQLSNQFRAVHNTITDMDANVVVVHDQLKHVENNDTNCGSTSVPLPCPPVTKSIYSRLEYFQLVSRLCQNTADLMAKKNLKMVPRIWRDAKDSPHQRLHQEVQKVHNNMQNWVKDWTRVLKKTGLRLMLENIGWGSTGESLKLVMTEEDQGWYARQYVESAIDTIEGFLKVKLK
ncbi:hypothetical protein P154DRAFT_524402 [Amniculicola lignicola CBS 123094]|uniref:N-acetyltransferase B complex non catalytic subunit-domain-containing protein n=1 Tax=Amniculicola lignicola CBS 123094 TaxID=1392246 RepID=A0A6A5WK80_9PLEO|nr:hypothetical protein P154DRAFT_524402 [Amniculicola lignicola CBS 123094]